MHATTHSPKKRKNQEAGENLTLSLPSSPVLWGWKLVSRNAQEPVRPQDANPLPQDWHGNVKTNAFWSAG